MTADPFEQLRLGDGPVAPDRRFVATPGVADALVAALRDAGAATV